MAWKAIPGGFLGIDSGISIGLARHILSAIGFHNILRAGKGAPQGMAFPTGEYGFIL